MSDQQKQSRLNRKSFIFNSLFFLPVIVTGIWLGNAHSDSDFTQGMMGIARLVALVLAGIYIRFTVRRLHDAGRSGWFSFLLIPPATLFCLIYLVIAQKAESNKWGNPTSELRIFGIHARGWRIAGIIIVAILLVYLAGLFATFFFDSGTY
ncbi:MAG TPA: DUF805 domain-containing protein [Verrucomicrobiae bacterium]|nr:DUF805 domain-containing protein [Verrucomicrobiae bacterium]